MIWFLGMVSMLEKKIREMKQQLDQMILTEDLSNKRLLHHSQALDLLLVDYMRRNVRLHSSSNKASSQSQCFIENNNKEKNATRLQHDYNLICDLIRIG